MSQKDLIRKEIEGVEFVFTMLPPRKARKWINKALGFLSNGVGVIGDAAVAKGVDTALPVGSALAKAIESFEPDLLDQFMDELAGQTTVNEIPLSECYDTTFRGRPGLQYVWFLTAVEVQFADFGPALSGWVKRRFGADKAEKLASLSRAISTG